MEGETIREELLHDWAEAKLLTKLLTTGYRRGLIATHFML